MDHSQSERHITTSSEDANEVEIAQSRWRNGPVHLGRKMDFELCRREKRRYIEIVGEMNGARQIGIGMRRETESDSPAASKDDSRAGIPRGIECLLAACSGDTTPCRMTGVCKVTPVILHGVISPDMWAPLGRRVTRPRLENPATLNPQPAAHTRPTLVSNARGSGDTTPCRMTGVPLHSHVRYEEM